MDIVRVGTLNNFNCTKKEWDQLATFQNPNRILFINCNAKTPGLLSINDHPYKAVITVNPDLIPNEKLIDKVLSLDPTKVAFVRVKWLPDRPDIQQVILRLRSAGLNVVITSQRFRSHESMKKYSNPEHYAHEYTWFRLHGKAWKSLLAFAKKTGALICDKKGLGCQGCHNCSTLNGGTSSDRILSLNMSSSGVCPFNCLDCYAKAIQERCTKGNPIAYNKVKANRKQKGNTQHIINNKKAA